MTGVVADPGQLLADAEAALDDAAAAPEASTRRRCHAHHAATVASDVIMSTESSGAQREQATVVLHRALAWAQLPGTLEPRVLG